MVKILKRTVLKANLLKPIHMGIVFTDLLWVCHGLGPVSYYWEHASLAKHVADHAHLKTLISAQRTSLSGKLMVSEDSQATIGKGRTKG